MGDQESKKEKYPWAGPALFGIVLAGLVVFFWWLVTA
jgi:hypothetical protein